MITIKLIPPRGYAMLKPLHDSTGRPIQCPLREHKWYFDLTEDHRHTGDPESLLVWLCDDCADRLAAELQFAGTDAFCDIACWQCSKPLVQAERTTP